MTSHLRCAVTGLYLHKSARYLVAWPYEDDPARGQRVARIRASTQSNTKYLRTGARISSCVGILFTRLPVGWYNNDMRWMAKIYFGHRLEIKKCFSNVEALGSAWLIPSVNTRDQQIIRLPPINKSSGFLEQRIVSQRDFQTSICYFIYKTILFFHWHPFQLARACAVGERKKRFFDTAWWAHVDT